MEVQEQQIQYQVHLTTYAGGGGGGATGGAASIAISLWYRWRSCRSSIKEIAPVYATVNTGGGAGGAGGSGRYRYRKRIKQG
jgi:hypothetical protein